MEWCYICEERRATDKILCPCCDEIKFACEKCAEDIPMAPKDYISPSILNEYK